MISVYDYLKPAIPNDTAIQTSAFEQIANRVTEQRYKPATILDLGCGVGASLQHFQELLPDAKWTGVDIESSPEVNARKLQGGEFVTYDGVNLPFDNDSFDLIYSHQVFEHVRHPEPLLAEVTRVLKPGGLFVGQTSHLEPYHSYSIFNFTPYGWKVICDSAGLELKELRPGIDGITLTKRSYLGRPPQYNRWFAQESPLNKEIADACKDSGQSIQVTNFRKLQYCGQFVFICSVRSESGQTS